MPPHPLAADPQQSLGVHGEPDDAPLVDGEQFLWRGDARHERHVDRFVPEIAQVDRQWGVAERDGPTRQMSASCSAPGISPSSLRTAKSMADIRTKYSASTPSGRMGTWSDSSPLICSRACIASVIRSAPFILHTFHTGDAQALSNWARTFQLRLLIKQPSSTFSPHTTASPEEILSEGYYRTLEI